MLIFILCFTAYQRNDTLCAFSRMAGFHEVQYQQTMLTEFYDMTSFESPSLEEDLGV